MDTGNTKESPKQPTPDPMLVYKVLWASLLVSTLIYPTVAIKSMGITLDRELVMDTAAIPFLAAIAAAFIASFIVPRIMMSSIIHGRSKGDALATSWEQIRSRLFVPFIVRLALLDAVAVLGFTMSVMNQNGKYCQIFSAVAFVSILTQFPSDGRWKAWIAK